MFRQALQDFVHRHSVQLGIRTDADSMFFTRQLEQVLAKEYDKEFPELTIASGSLLPMDSEVQTGAESYVYYYVEPTGMAKILNTYADTDLPEIGLAGKETVGKIVAIGAVYGWSFQDLRTAAMANRDITTRKGNASKQSHMMVANKLGWFGDMARGLYGLLTHPNITYTLAPFKAGGSTAADRLWSAKTFEEILADVGTLINTPADITRNVEKVDTVVFPSKVANALAARVVSPTNGSNVNIWNFLKGNFPGVTFVTATELDITGHEDTEFVGVNVAVAFKKDPDKISFVMPQPYEQFPPQEKLLRVIIPTHSRCGAVKCPAPLSVHVMTGF
jgi:hypothetical protein